MTTIVTRAGKGAALTHNEVDANFVNLNTDKVEKSGTDPVIINANSSSDALRITQTGTGNALVVEDSANPDSTPFVVTGEGAVGIGLTAPNARLEVASDTSNEALIVRYNASDTAGVTQRVQKSRGTGAAPTVVSSGDTVFNLAAQGYDGSNYVTAARIYSEVDGTPGTNDMPGRLMFSTTADGASSPTERMRINSSGQVLIGTTTNTNASRLVINGTISETVGSTQYLTVSQSDVGTAQNQIPLNQYLGALAYRTNAMVSVPASATAAGNKGDIAQDDDYLYVCIAQNTWKRVGISTW